MSRSALIIGSGPAAAGAALALLDTDDITITVLDVGGRLEARNAAARERLGSQDSWNWSHDDLSVVSRLPEDSDVEGLPEKRSYGSDYPFRDLGQLNGITTDGVNRAVVSSALGGFSNVWGAQVMPFPEAAFDEWPFHASDLRDHYAAVLRAIPYAAQDDDLSHHFPLLADSVKLPELSPRSKAILARYEDNPSAVNRLGVTLGRARLAMAADECIRCGLCMTGCPYKLIYSAADTWRNLINHARVSYVNNLLAVSVNEHPSGAAVVTRDLVSGETREFTADRVFLACGAIGTSRLVMGSLRLFEEPVIARESVQFVLPFLSRRAVPDPQRAPNFTLNQFNMAVSLDDNARDLAHLHFYTFDQAFELALPRVLRRARLSGLRSRVFRHLSVALGYVPSWASATFSLAAQPPAGEYELPAMRLSAPAERSPTRDHFMRGVLERLVRAGSALDCWPATPVISYSAPAKSYHFGGTFPHQRNPAGRFASDQLGRVAPWTRVHLVDASVFPTIAATTFTLTIMANARRIASEIAGSAAW